MHVNLRSIVDTTKKAAAIAASITAPSSPIIPSATNLAHTSAERSTIKNNDSKYTQSLPPIVLKSEQLPSPPTSPKTYSDTDPLNYHYFQSPNKKSTTTNAINTNNNNDTLPPSTNCHTDRHFQILRMELEFLHFLNYDLSLSDTMKLIHWARRFNEDNRLSSFAAGAMANNSGEESHYSSGDEGGDEWEAEDH